MKFLVKKPIYKESGFTIVELLIVIVVIAILAAIVTVAYNGIQNQARAAQLKSYLNSAAKAITVYKVNKTVDEYPASLSVAGVASDTSMTAEYTYDNVSQTFCISAQNTQGQEMYITDAGNILDGSCLDFGVIGHWKLNGNASDSSTMNNAGSVVNAALTTGWNGKPNSAYHFAGNGYIDLGSSSAYVTPALSLSVWVKRDALGTNETIFHNGAPKVQFYVNGMKPGIRYGGSSSYEPVGSINTDWTHFVYIFDGAHMKARIYKNGAQMGTDYTFNKTLYTGGANHAYLATTTSAPFDAPGSQNYNGTLDDVRYYNRILTPDEVVKLYTSGAQ